MGGSTVSKSSQYIMLPLGYRLPRKGKQTSTDFSLVMIVFRESIWLYIPQLEKIITMCNVMNYIPYYLDSIRATSYY